MNIQQIAAELKKPFPSEDRQARFSQNRMSQHGAIQDCISWQKIRDRLDLVCPDWQVSYSDPILVADYVTVRCQLTIANVTREATGSDKGFFRLHDNGSDQSSRHESSRDKFVYAPERAMVNAFINAAAQFGISSPIIPEKLIPKLPQHIPQQQLSLPAKQSPKASNQVTKQLPKQLPKRTPKQAPKQMPKQTPKQAPKQASLNLLSPSSHKHEISEVVQMLRQLGKDKYAAPSGLLISLTQLTARLARWSGYATRNVTRK
jgi:hypothetical protein